MKRPWSSGYDCRLPSDRPGFNSRRTHFCLLVLTTNTDKRTFFFINPEHATQTWWHGVVVSISGCDPLDPGSNPGAVILFVFLVDI